MLLLQLHADRAELRARKSGGGAGRVLHSASYAAGVALRFDTATEVRSPVDLPWISRRSSSPTGSRPGRRSRPLARPRPRRHHLCHPRSHLPVRTRNPTLTPTLTHPRPHPPPIRTASSCISARARGRALRRARCCPSPSTRGRCATCYCSRCAPSRRRAAGSRRPHSRPRRVCRLPSRDRACRTTLLPLHHRRPRRRPPRRGPRVASWPLQSPSASARARPERMTQNSSPPADGLPI